MLGVGWRVVDMGVGFGDRLSGASQNLRPKTYSPSAIQFISFFFHCLEIKIPTNADQLIASWPWPFRVFELEPLTRKLEKVAGGTFFEPENPLHAEQFWRQVKVEELLKLLEGEGLVGAKRHRDKAIVIQVVGVMVMVFVGMVMVMMMVVVVVGLLMVVTVVVSLVLGVMIVTVIMGGFFGIGLSHRLIQAAIAHLHIDNQG